MGSEKGIRRVATNAGLRDGPAGMENRWKSLIVSRKKSILRTEKIPVTLRRILSINTRFHFNSIISNST